MKKIRIIENNLLNEAEIKVPEGVLQKIKDDISQAYDYLDDPGVYTLTPDGKKMVTNGIYNVPFLLPEKMAGRYIIYSKPSAKLEEYIYTNNKKITNGLVLFWAMNCLATDPGDAIVQRDKVAALWDKEKKQFPDDLIEKAKKFEMPILFSLQASPMAGVGGFVVEKLRPNGMFAPTLTICMLNNALKTYANGDNEILEKDKVVPTLERIVDHETRHITQIVNEKCVRYGNEIQQFKGDFSKIKLIPSIDVVFPPNKTITTEFDFSTLQVKLVDYNPDYKSTPKEKHSRMGASAPDSATHEFFGLGKGKLDLKNPDIGLLQRLGWSQKQTFERYLKTDIEYATWMGDLLTAFMDAIKDSTDEKLINLLKNGAFNSAAIYAIKDYENHGKIMEAVAHGKEYFVQFYIVAKVNRGRHFYGDLVKNLTLRIEKEYGSKVVKKTTFAQRKAEKEKKSLKETSKYRKMVRKFSNWLDNN